MKTAGLLSLCAILLGGAPQVFARAGELTTPGFPIPSTCSEAARERIAAILRRPDFKFLGGNFVNRFTTHCYARDTTALNLYLDELAHCPGVALSVSFVKSLTQAGDWLVHHDPHRNRFDIRVSLASAHIELEKLVVPEVVGRDPADNPAAMTLLGYQEFDQKPGRGWRALADQKRFADAGKVIENYLARRSDMNAQDRANLHFHAAQCLAIEGRPASIQTALAHLKDARVQPEPTNSPMRWNDYVAATEAFLRSDRAALQAARERIADGPKLDSVAANLDVVDRLIANFGKSYTEAYGGDSKQQKRGDAAKALPASPQKKP